MDSSHSAADFSRTSYSPVTFKECSTELRRQALERLLSAVYKREVSISVLLLDSGASLAVLEALRYRNIGSVAERMIDEIKQLICLSDGGPRRYQIIERYYGLDGNMPARLSAMATKYGVSRERIRQIKERCLLALRYKKAAIEKLLLDLSMRLLTRRSSGIRSAANAAEPALENFQLNDYQQLLFYHESKVPFTDEQSKVMFDLHWSKRARITGCAGSGKTALALMTARRLAASGERTLLTCFSRSLADHLSELLKDQKNLVVSSFHALCLRVGKQVGITAPGGWNNRAWLEKFPDMLKKAMLSDPAMKFDAIIVDEAQDFRDNWWEAIERSLAGSDSSRLFYFMDDNEVTNQTLAKLPSVDHTAHLSINLRNPMIASSMLTNSYKSFREMKFARGTPAPIEFYRCEDEETMVQTIEHVVYELVDKGKYLSTDLVMLTPRSPKLSSALLCRFKGTTRVVRRLSDIPNHAILSRSFTFKGLERRVGIIIDLDDRFAMLTDDEIRSFVYMSFSRFIERLVVLGSQSSWNRIENLSPPAFTQTPIVHANWLQPAAPAFNS